MAELDDDIGKQFAKNLHELFAQLPLVPEDEIASVLSSGYCEDGRSFVLLLTTKSGKTIRVRAEPGKSLSVRVV
jgi:hypothetical protein